MPDSHPVSVHDPRYHSIFYGKNDLRSDKVAKFSRAIFEEVSDAQNIPYDFRWPIQRFHIKSLGPPTWRNGEYTAIWDYPERGWRLCILDTLAFVEITKKKDAFEALREYRALMFGPVESK